ncbi:MAG TPA: 4a-hydroxytetrahydrobiopterin dehydratase [Actinomycetota bacterium]|jgi:pterin-4a-carbinolamine dehydratase|nr:4a-hydroxytetrahydrobiopterin dehydratase [Actinomycetota bacterium]
MDQATLDQELRALPGWTPVGGRIVKAFEFDGFRSAMRFVARVADAAAGVDDQVAIEVTGGTATLAVFTPGTEAVTDTGLALAHRIERLTGDHQHPVGLAGP